MASFDHISGAEPSTVTFKLATVKQTRNSSVMHQEIMSLGDPDSSLAIAAVLNAVPASTAWGLVTRQVGNSSIQGDSTVFQGGTWNVSSVAGAVTVRSSAANALVSVYQSTAADLQATVAQASTVWAVQLTQYSTIVAVSSLGGAVIVRSSAANALVSVYQSTATDLLATVSQSGTWTVNLGTHLQSTAAPSSNSSGLVVRQVIDGLTTFASTSALASTSVEIASSAAGIRHYVTGYTITSTNQTAAHWGFFSSNATLLWPITLAALSSATVGANLAVAPPGYLFRTVAADALNFKSAGSTVAGVQMGVSYYRAV